MQPSEGSVTYCNAPERAWWAVHLQDYPEHRLQFFSLLRAITNHCFDTLFTMSPDQLKLVIDSIVWAFRHTERNIAETGTPILQDVSQQTMPGPL